MRYYFTLTDNKKIMEITLILLVPTFILLAGAEWATISVYGWKVSQETEKEYLNINSDSLKRIKGSNIIYFKDFSTHKYIATVGLSLFFKYYIRDRGVVLKWSPLHKKINKLYKEVEAV